jgi:hypothetical protein
MDPRSSFQGKPAAAARVSALQSFRVKHFFGIEVNVNARLRISQAVNTGWAQNRARPEGTDNLKVGVAGITSQIVFRDGKPLTVSFYLRLAGAGMAGRETLGERLNDPGTRFLACKVDERVEILNLSAISLIRVMGALPEIAAQERQGAIRQPARVAMGCGETLRGEFLCVAPSTRVRLSDLLNAPDRRFLLFLAEGRGIYLRREDIVRVVP